MPLQLENRRQQLIAQLSDEYANDIIEVEEFERRVERLEAAEQADELERVAREFCLDVVPPSAGAERSLAHVAPSTRTLVAIMGGVNRDAGWHVPGRLRLIAVMGGVKLDLRGAQLSGEVTHIDVFALWGGVEIIVPPELRVEWNGVSIMGGVQQRGEPPAAGHSGGPVLLLGGLVMMAGVHVIRRGSTEPLRVATASSRQITG